MSTLSSVRRGWPVPVLLMLVLAATTAGPAGADSPLGAAGPVSADDSAQPVGAVSTEVLLLSGDQVTYTAYPDGTNTVAIDAADRTDGRSVAFETVQSEDGYYVLPADAWPLLANGTLDRQLFNVTTLVEDGLTDADQLPVIVTTDPSTPGTLRAEALSASAPTATLASIDGAAFALDGDGATALWDELTVAGDGARTASVATRIWLDRAVEVTLDESVPQIGVPDVWDAGYDGSGTTVAVLDTGVDPEHPDLADRIVGTNNFTPDPSFVDGHGHGTHVASIVAGSGEASEGTYRGVAPGADLLIGKVLPDSGTGPTSAVIEGMEWAANAGADVVNLSLSGSPTDGTDPASLAVEALTAQTGALFVIAAGNDSGDAAVGSPGTATSALTVGAVDKQDALASFSNRGPRRGFVDGEFGTGWAVQYAPTSLYMQPAEFSTGWLEVTENWQVANSLISTAEIRVGEQRLEITPAYHNFFAAPRIAGERELALVWAGTGTPDELDAAGVAGKTALVGITVPTDAEPNPPTYVFNAHNQITDDAVALGASGVVFYVDEPGALGLPGDGPRSDDVLQLSIPYEEGIEARALVQDGPAQLVLHAERDPDRIYRLREWHEDPSLPDPRREVDLDDLAAVQTRYHSDEPGFTQRTFSSAFTPRESVVGGLTPSYWAPLAVTEYILPGEHLRWVRNVTQLGPPGSFSGETLETRERFLPGDMRELETWFQSPMRTGAADVPHDTQYENLLCTFCRQADRFRPGLYYLDTDSRHRTRSFLLEGTAYRMFSNGVEIPNSGSSTTPWFELDPEPATYRLEMEGVQPGVPQVRTLAPRIDTAWTFSSSRPSGNAKPKGYDCPFSSVEGGCAFQPLLQLDYQLDLDLLNRAPADGSHTFTVEVAPHSQTDKELVQPVPASQVDVWYSTDGGATWDEAHVRPSGRSTFDVAVEHPPLEETDSYVWLRADARDVAGNRVEQTIERAYGLADR
jgi:subtilisin family serine protease